MSLQTSLHPFALWANFVSIRSAWEDEVPLDEVCYSCNHCEEIVNLNPNGIFIINDAIEEPLPTVLNNIETYALEEHITDSEDCPGESRMAGRSSVTRSFADFAGSWLHS